MYLFDQGILFLISLLANLFSAFSGGGAGLVQLPALIFLGLPFSIALATHKVATVALGAGATLRYLRNNALDRSFAFFVLACGLPGVVLGANVILNIPDRTAELALGGLTLSLGIYSLLKPGLGQVHQTLNRHWCGYLIGGSILFLIGLLNGALSSGTGLFATLWLVRWFGLDYKQAGAYTLVLVGLFWNSIGALTLGWLGNIQWSWLPALLIGSLLGGYLGAHLALVKGSRWIKRGFETVTLLVGLKLIIG
ncbi:sulfite exporter TauE/SafE-like protein [Candidatus Nitrosoglobus terrae]|uniref:Probable membrane transporter protein n=1 Tax=Candidatus Nitrosoglobus terrae TaxID=1630141 RepID=A0A1Q2SJY4_9GAMM|nr:sulfite exporter TauE/SafE family protein [Candidatus Nitrosoglobus terrae]BAW79438.1 sulfite exporter TauE/SafE-like protein [Candidatus Nitrosoglobus terrae]